MAAVVESKRAGISSRASAGFAVWGNWYINRTSHEFGWASHYACLNYAGLFVGGHKILFDTPEAVRLIDVAVGRLPELLRHALVLKYWWDRDIRGFEIDDRRRAAALELDTASQYREILRTAKWLGEKEIEKLDHRRETCTIR